MSGVATAIGASAVIGGVVQSRAASKAASAAGDAASSGIAEQRAARESFESRTDPFRQLGVAGSNELASFLGLVSNPDASQFDAELQGLKDTLAGTNQSKRRRFSAELRQKIANLEEQKSAIPQFIQGDGGIQQLEEINPLVSFLRDQGFEAIQESAAAGGRLSSGGTLKDLTQFNTDLTSTIVPQLQNQRFNQLFNVAGLGANVAAGQGTAGLQTAANIGNLQTFGANATAAGAVGRANAITGTAQNLASVAGAFPSVFGEPGVPINQQIANNPNTLGTITPAF